MEKNLTKWRCSHCGYTIESQKPPEPCPNCQSKCSFTDVTCYIPECGGEKNIDPKLFEKKSDPDIKQ
jgi:rubredoxin